MYNNTDILLFQPIQLKSGSPSRAMGMTMVMSLLD